MHRGVVWPGQCDDPRPGLAVNLCGDCVYLVRVRAGDGGEVGSLLQSTPVRRRGGVGLSRTQEAQLGVLVEGAGSAWRVKKGGKHFEFGWIDVYFIGKGKSHITRKKGKSISLRRKKYLEGEEYLSSLYSLKVHCPLSSFLSPLPHMCVNFPNRYYYSWSPSTTHWAKKSRFPLPSDPKENTAFLPLAVVFRRRREIRKAVKKTKF